MVTKEKNLIFASVILTAFVLYFFAIFLCSPLSPFGKSDGLTKNDAGTYEGILVNPTVKSGLTYDDVMLSEQELINAGVSSNGYTIKYKLGDGEWSTSIPVGLMPGTYIVYFSAFSSENDKKMNEGMLAISIEKSVASVIELPTANVLIYTGSQQSLITSGTAAGGTLEYSLGGGAWSSEIPVATNAGEYTVFYRVKGDDYHKDSDIYSLSVVISKSDSYHITSNPTAMSDLIYNGLNQSLINAGVVDGGTMEYRLNANGSWSTAIPTAKDVGVYTVYYRVKGDETHSDSPVYSLVVKIDKSATEVKVTSAPTPRIGLVSNGSAQILVNAGTCEGGTMEYSLGNGVWSTKIPAAKEAGDYTVYYRAVGDNGFISSVQNVKVKIVEGSNATIITRPVARNLVYNGTVQTLITPASANSGTIQYCLNSFSTWSTQVPSAVDAGLYTVSYRLLGDSKVNSVYVTIAKAASRVNAQPTVVSGLEYTGSAQQLLSSTGSAVGGQMQFSLDKNNWSNSIPKAVEAGSYNVYYRVLGDSNHTNSTIGSVSVVISASSSNITVKPTARSLVYTGNQLQLITAGVVDGGTMEYRLGSNGVWNTNLPTAVNAGMYNVYYRVAGSGNYEIITVTIARARAIITEQPRASVGLVANNTQQLLLSSLGSSVSGTMRYSLGDGVWSTNVPTASKAGTYTVLYKVVGDSNHTDSDVYSITVIIA